MPMDQLQARIAFCIYALWWFLLLAIVISMDYCQRKVKRTYKVWPSARASEAVAKCRKQHGNVRKGKAGRNLRRWERERWKDTITKKPCGSGGKTQYCRPSKKISKSTPSMPRGRHLRQLQGQKRRGIHPRAKRSK